MYKPSKIVFLGAWPALNGLQSNVMATYHSLC